MKSNQYVLMGLSVILASSFISEAGRAANMCSQVFATLEMSTTDKAKDLVRQAAAREADLKNGVESYVAKILSDRRIWSEKDSNTIAQIEKLMKAKDFDARMEFSKGQYAAVGNSVAKLKSLVDSLDGLQNMKMGMSLDSALLYVLNYKTIGQTQTFVSPAHVLSYMRAEQGLLYLGANGLGKDRSSAEFLTARLSVLSQDLYLVSSTNSRMKQVVKGNVSDSQRVARIESDLDSVIKTVDQRFDLFQDNSMRRSENTQKALKKSIESYLVKVQADRRIWSEADAKVITQIEALMASKDFDAQLSYSKGEYSAVGSSVEKLNSLVHSLEGLKNINLDSKVFILYVVGYKKIGGQLGSPMTFVSPAHVLTFMRAEYGLHYFGANGLKNDRSSAEFLISRLNVLNYDLYNLETLKIQLKQRSEMLDAEGVSIIQEKIDRLTNAVDKEFEIFQD